MVCHGLDSNSNSTNNSNNSNDSSNNSNNRHNSQCSRNNSNNGPLQCGWRQSLFIFPPPKLGHIRVQFVPSCVSSGEGPLMYPDSLVSKRGPFGGSPR